MVAASPLLDAGRAEADVIGQLQIGDPFDLLDDSLGWAWGYAGKDRRVGYVRSSALGDA
ncbi:hypothetical protein H8M03_12330 [Sphingomonas sabuli]|uniref:Bacterial dipeptidyl-peptidase SH3 domain-containing protein n=1 Tax=Sphingomonas sabuli TaxID=2764186 RepID=A0A7G9L2A5_9SPHN|nr:hypothetical protein [Sphingomonas sabuli]QNM82754.1 hypothetical protein H8M03_12330 [Sphingomonas sabuli]